MALFSFLYNKIFVSWLRLRVSIIFYVLPRLSHIKTQLKILNCFVDLAIQRAFGYKHNLICFMLENSSSSG